MRIFVCDDEPQIVKQIGETVHSVLVGECVSEFTSSAELIQALKKEVPEILLLDIDMPEISGLNVAEVLKELPYGPLLVFVTSHDELVYDSLQFHPFGFVRKSFLDIELPKILADCEKELRNKKAIYHFRNAEGDMYLPLSEILYFESDGNYLVVFTRSGSYRFRETLATVQEELANKGFVRIHKGFLVNMAVVKLLGVNQLTLENGSLLPIGRNFGDEAKKQIMRYMLR